MTLPIAAYLRRGSPPTFPPAAQPEARPHPKPSIGPFTAPSPSQPLPLFRPSPTRPRPPPRSQPANSLDFRDLLCDALFEQSIPARELLGLLLQLRRLQLHCIVKFLDAEQRADAGHQRRLLEGLGEIIVTARLETIDDVARVG